MAVAESRIRRYMPAEAWAAAEAGEAVIVDVRSEAACAEKGVVPRSVHVARSVLEWRLAPDSDWHDRDLVGRSVILICDEGFSTVLAAATLVELGVDAGDVRGGFEAWQEAALPVLPPK